MSRIVGVADPGALESAARILDAGGIVVIPTDTVYGVAGRVDRPEALRRIFSVKRRPLDKPLPVLCASLEEAARIAVLEGEALDAARAGWPGPLTLVLHRAPGFDADLGGGETVGVRVPDHAFVLALLAVTGPLAATSANLSGEAVPGEVAAIAEVIGEGVDLLVDAGPCDSPPSKVVSFVSGGEILRGRPRD